MPSNAEEKVVKAAFEKAKEWSGVLSKKSFYYQTVYNDFYSGSVRCGGLLMYKYYKKYLKKFIDNNFKPDLVLINRDSFDLLEGI